MKLSKADQSALIISFTEAIQRCKITSYSYASVGKDWVDQSLSGLDSETAKKVNSAVEGMEHFFNRQIMKRFFREGYTVPSTDEKEKRLTTYKHFSEPLRIARELCSEIEAIPRQYRLFMEGPSGFDPYIPNDFDLKISDQLSLTSGSLLSPIVALRTEPESYHNYVLSGAIKAADKLEIDEDISYFVYRTSGYIGNRWQSSLVEDFFDAVRSFYGAALSNGFFYPIVTPGKSRVPYTVANEIDANNSEFVYVSAVEEDIKRASNLFFKSEHRKLLEGGESLQSLLQPVSDVFVCKEPQRMTTAAVWLLRAHMSSRGIDQILESAIAIEILLGDREASDRVGLSKLMANRCAYSLGGSARERKELIDFFTKYYKVRSDIVHSGRLRITEDESEVVSRGVKLASRLLCHEVKLACEPGT